MDFSLTSDQKMMQDSLARTLGEAAALDRVRRFADDPTDRGANQTEPVGDVISRKHAVGQRRAGEHPAEFGDLLDHTGDVPVRLLAPIDVADGDRVAVTVTVDHGAGQQADDLRSARIDNDHLHGRFDRRIRRDLVRLQLQHDREVAQ